MEYTHLGSAYGKEIYFPINSTLKQLYLIGPIASGKTTVLNSLQDYYHNNKIKYVIINNKSKFSINAENIENIMCMFKLVNKYIYIHDDICKYVLKNIDTIYGKSILNNFSTNKYYTPDTEKFLFIINLFYILTIEKNQIIIIDELDQMYSMLSLSLIEDSDINKVITSLQVPITLINSNSVDLKENMISIENCLKSKL